MQTILRLFFSPQTKLILFLVLGLTGASRFLWAAPGQAQYVEGEVLVTFKPSADLSAAQKILAGHGLQLATHFKELSQWTHRQTALARARGRTTKEIIAELQQEPAVETAEPNYLRWPDAQ